MTPRWRKEELVAKQRQKEKQGSDKRAEAARAVIDASRRCLIDHYEHRDLDATLSCMVDDVWWLGPMDCQHSRNAKDMRLILEPEYGTPMRMRDERWDARPAGDVWIVAGLFCVDALDEENASVVTFHQSATFVWAPTDQGFRVVHLHVSNAHDVPSRTGVPLELGEDAVAYSMQVIAEGRAASKARKIAFKNMTGVVNYLSPDEVICLEVDGPQTVRVVHEGGSFQVHASLSDVAEGLPGRFVRTHRSCVVNATHVVETVRYRVMLDNGMRCPVAEKRYHEVRRAIESAIAL